MSQLGITRAEAIQLIADDKAIDHGEKLFELPPELAKGAKKARFVARSPSKPIVLKPKPKKINSEKRKILASLIGAINTPVEVKNPEREFLFTLNGTLYRVTLACPRK